jgi:hypothetical protein
MRLSSAVLAAAAFTLCASGAFAQDMMSVNLTGAEEVPPVETAGTGTANLTWNADTKELSWVIEFSGLSGPATAAHFHGPAAPGENAGPVITIEDLESPSEGSATLTDEQAAQLAGGQWYVNVHTEANGGGEIRGQIGAAM